MIRVYLSLDADMDAVIADLNSVVNVVDLMTLEPSTEHPYDLSDRGFDTPFTRDKPIIFAYQGFRP